jgi:hypothetical protein
MNRMPLPTDVLNVYHLAIGIKLSSCLDAIEER